MKYFDNEFLKQYLDLGFHPKVYVNGRYLEIVDYEDIDDPQQGVGIDPISGEDVPFKYEEIEEIKVANKILTLDMLNGKGNSDEEDEESEGGSGERASDNEFEPPKESIRNRPFFLVNELYPLSDIPNNTNEIELEYEKIRRIIFETEHVDTIKPFEIGDVIEIINKNSELYGSTGIVKNVMYHKPLGWMVECVVASRLLPESVESIIIDATSLILKK